MRKFSLRNLLLILTGVVFVDFLFFYKNKVDAQNLQNIIFEELNINYPTSKLNNLSNKDKYSNLENLSKGEFIKVLGSIDSQLSNLLVFESQDISESFEVNIISDIQYQENEKLYAEGNAEVFFSNANLKGDLITYDKI